MVRSDQRDHDLEALQERLSRLSQASLRINESLDFDKVLQGVLDSARSVTAARYGAMTLFDDGGRVQDYLSSGLTSQEAERLWLMPEGLRIFESLIGVSEPMRVPDLVGHIRSLGFTGFSLPLPVGRVFPFLAAPMFHRGARVGHVFLGDRDSDEFSQADEETLVMFASQAALVIANARTHREERQARADLETLVNTSPVGVVVLDARTGAPVSFNREALRIVDGLREKDQLAEDLLEVVTCVRSDGREIPLGELPLAEALRGGETVRAEEIALRVADGRSVTVLLNATPIHGEDGQLASFVVTLQDMTPLEEQERLRAEFLAMVSHELRTPLAAVKGSITTLLESAKELDPAEMTQFFRIIRDQSDQMRFLIGDLLDVARIETGALPVDPVPSELQPLVHEAKSKFPTGGAGNALKVDLAEDLPLVMADRRRIVQVLSNLLSNSAGYSPETRAGAYRRTCCRGFSASSRGHPASTGPAWDSPSARASWRHTGDASGPRATARASGRGSHSRFQRWRPRPPQLLRHPPVRGRQLRAGSASWQWTTTRRRSGTSETSSPGPATRPS